MSSFELNKIFAAVLVAGIIAMFSGFVAEQLTYTHALEKNAVEIEGSDLDAGGGAAAVAIPEPVLQLIASAEVAKGEKLSKACAACHSFNKGGAAMIGPNLWNIVGSPKGAKAGFDYSAGMHAKGGAWSYADLNYFFWKPKKFIDGTKMNFIGLKKPEDRAAIIAWMRTLSDSPKPLPSAGEIAKEAAELAPPAAAESEEAPAEASAH
jgi:cytochrome c